MKWLIGGVALAVLGAMATLSVSTTAADESDDGDVSAAVLGEMALATEGGGFDAVINFLLSALGEDAGLTGGAAITADPTAGEGGVSANAETDASAEITAEEGDDATAEEGDDAAAEEGDDAAAEEGDDATAEEGDDATGEEADGTTSEDAMEDDDASAGASSASSSATEGGEATTETAAAVEVEATIFEDGECTLDELWGALDAILVGEFPNVGNETVLPAAACEELLSMVESSMFNQQDELPCRLPEVVGLIDGLEAIGSPPDIELPSQVCMLLFGLIGEDTPIFFGPDEGTTDDAMSPVDLPAIISLP